MTTSCAERAPAWTGRSDQFDRARGTAADRVHACGTAAFDTSQTSHVARRRFSAPESLYAGSAELPTEYPGKERLLRRSR
jgi:hypothetical protein